MVTTYDRRVMSTERSPSQLAELPSWAMTRLSNVARGWLVDGLAGHGLRLAHYNALANIDEFGPISQSGLACHTGIDPSDLVQILDDLVQRGDATRSVDPDDRRRRLITLTDAGRTTLAACRSIADDATDRLLAPLTRSEASAFRRSLATLLAHHDGPGVERA